MRLQNDKDTDQGWLESVAAFLGSSPPDKWKQNNITQAEYRLKEFSDRLKELAKVHAEQQKVNGSSHATLIRMVSENVEYSEIAYLSDQLKQQADVIIIESLSRKLFESGSRTRRRGTFFCFAKRKYPKKRRPDAA